MKLLLTSSGLTNDSIVNALRELAGKPFDDLSLAFIPTAANLEKGDKSWLIRDLDNSGKLGFKAIDVVDISAIDKKLWLPRLEKANILLFGGGNTYHLSYFINKSGLKEILPKLLEEKVYVGISAGSIIATHSLVFSNQEKKEFAESIGESPGDEGLGFVKFHIRPHLNNPKFPHAILDAVESKAKNFTETVYAIDDQTAIKVDGKTITVISEGEWKKFN